MNDNDLIERLRAAGSQGPTPRATPDAVLAAGRRAQSRRTAMRMSGAALGVAAVVVAGLQLTPGNAGTQTVNAAGDGGLGDGPAPAPAKPVPQSAPELNKNADHINAAILQAAMGDDFNVADDSPNGDLQSGTKSAAGLPTQYSGTVSLSTMVSNGAGLKEMCAPLVEKGATFDGCVTRTLPDGREVQVDFSRWAPTATYPSDTAGESVRVFFLQPNGVLAWTDLVTSTDADASTAATAGDAKAWLNSMVDRLGAASANPDLEAQGFDGDHCTAVDDTNWDCTSSHSAPAEKPAPADEKAIEAKKAAAAESEAMDAKKAAAIEADKTAAADEKPSPGDEKAIAAKKAAAAGAEAMDAKKAAAEKCAAAGKC